MQDSTLGMAITPNRNLHRYLLRGYQRHSYLSFYSYYLLPPLVSTMIDLTIGGAEA